MFGLALFLVSQGGPAAPMPRPLPPDPPLAAAYAFVGPNAEIATANLRACEAHAKQHLWPLPVSDYRFDWSCRQTAAKDAWLALERALTPWLPEGERRASLGQLRRIIGRDAFLEGRMPAAVPDYGAWPPNRAAVEIARP